MRILFLDNFDFIFLIFYIYFGFMKDSKKMIGKDIDLFFFGFVFYKIVYKIVFVDSF